MKFVPHELPAVNAVVRRGPEKDFRLSILGLLLFAAAVGSGIAIPVGGGVPFDREALGIVLLGSFFAGLILFLFPIWILDLVFILALGIALRWAFGEDFFPSFLVFLAGFILIPTVQIAQQWEKVVVFRLGRFRGLRGPGVFLIMPIIDRAARFIDTRIRVVEFRHETTLTKDTVPVSVDAIAFWMVWDAEKATLEVEDYLDSVTLAAHAALRNAIGKHELASLLSEQEKLGKEIQEFLDAKTNPWGITILSIGITDIIISKELEDSLSKQAQAQRERQSRLILAEAEQEIADNYVEASKRYRDNPTALQLRGMSITYEGIRKNGTIVLLPSGAVQDLALGKIMDDAAKRKKPLEDLKMPGRGPQATEEGT
jgi:regulator of protease activity HflC (stomatin/prohibitin superfamily)